MNNKISFPELAALLSLRTSLSKKACEDFLREYAATVASALAEGEYVRIKGFGTFKLNAIEPRKSVNVSSGKEMEIPGHFRISFTPAKELAEAINSPFEAFEAVELADDFEDAQAEDTSVITEYTEAADSPGQRAIEETSYIFEYNDLAEQSLESSIKTEPADDKPETQYHTSSSDDSSLNPKAEETTDTPLPKPEPEETPVYEQAVLEQFSSPIGNNDEKPSFSENETQSADNRRQHHRLRKHFIFGILTGIIMSIAAAGVCYMVLYYKVTRLNGYHTEIPTVATDTLPLPVATENVADKKAADIPNEPDTVSVPTQPSDQPTKPEPEYDTITTTRYLTTMAKDHYGNYHFWPYIYEENKTILGHPDRIRPGTKVKIPPLSKFGVSPDDPADVKRAKQKGVEIYSRFR